MSISNRKDYNKSLYLIENLYLIETSVRDVSI